jgi:outer membrane protein assembly factor BamD (BamD/ComL family)
MSQPNFDEYGQIIPDSSPGNSAPAGWSGPGYQSVSPNPAPVFNEFGELVSLPPQSSPPPAYQSQPPLAYAPVAVPTRRRSPAILWLIAGIVVVLILAVGGLGWLLWLRPAESSSPNPTAGTGGNGPSLVTLAEMDRLYSSGQAALASEQFKDAVSDFEQLREKQRQFGLQRYSDCNVLLFRSYVGAGQELAVSSNQLKDLEQSLAYFKKAIQLEPEIPSGQRDAQREAFVQQQVEYGELYNQGRSAFEGKRLDEAIDALGKLYAKTQSFRDGAAIYYNALNAQADILLKDKQLEQAYSYYAIAAKLANVPDNNNYARLRLASIEDQLKKAGKPVPTIHTTP